jgi:hypothetical protein
MEYAFAERYLSEVSKMEEAFVERYLSEADEILKTLKNSSGSSYHIILFACAYEKMWEFCFRRLTKNQYPLYIELTDAYLDLSPKFTEEHIVARCRLA